MNPVHAHPRRQFLKATVTTAAGLLVPAWSTTAGAPAIIAAEVDRPQALQGLQLGDPSNGSLLVWSRSDRAARMFVEWSYDEQFLQVQRIRGPHALETTDFTARLDLTGLKPGRDVFVRVFFQSLKNERAFGEPVTGHFVVPPAGRADDGDDNDDDDDDARWRRQNDLRFLWGGDTAGQGWGINQAFGGMKIYEAMRQRSPLFFIHSGDNIYADGPIAETAIAEQGRIWNNIVTPQVAKVAETLDEFRGRYRYNLLDENVRRFNAEVPQIWQWDDHEVTNNWSDSKDLSGDGRYTEKNVPLLVARGARAFLDYSPMRPFDARESQRVYRRFSYGPLLDVFVIDERNYRGPNTANLQPVAGADTAFLGEEQLAWLKAGLQRSRAVWKIVAADMPIGLNVGDGTTPTGQAR